MTTANQSGTFKIGGDMEVNRLGFGAMRITGPGIWGEPTDRAEAVRTLEALAPAGINFVDTADSYGPNVSELLIKEVLHPYKGMIVATKAGLTRSGPNQWSPKGNPEYLRAQALGSLERLGVEKIDLWQLHRIDGSVPRESQFEAVRSLVDDKLVRHVGLSEVSIADIEAASKHFKVATVQNQYNLVDRSHEDVLAFCENNGIGFIPWFPLAAGDLTKPGSVLDKVAADHDATPSQIALAWILRKSPVMLPIPGTSKAKHLNENVAATAIELTDAEFASLDKAGR
jgi:pyridoxine 4-dehydrogenase